MADDKTPKTPKAVEAADITPDAPRVSAALNEYDLSEAIIERRVVRDGGTVELRVVVPLPFEHEPDEPEAVAIEPEAPKAETASAAE